MTLHPPHPPQRPSLSRDLFSELEGQGGARGGGSSQVPRPRAGRGRLRATALSGFASSKLPAEPRQGHREAPAGGAGPASFLAGPGHSPWWTGSRAKEEKGPRPEEEGPGPASQPGPCGEPSLPSIHGVHPPHPVAQEPAEALAVPSVPPRVGTPAGVCPGGLPRGHGLRLPQSPPLELGWPMPRLGQ